MARRIHVSLSVEGALRNREFRGLLSEEGEPLSEAEAEERLWALHAEGVKMIPAEGCDSFSDQTGCLGHPSREAAGGGDGGV